MLNVAGGTVDAIDVCGAYVLEHDANRREFHRAEFTSQLQIGWCECRGCGLAVRQHRIHDERIEMGEYSDKGAYLTQQGRVHLLNVRMQLIQRIEIGFGAINTIQNGTVAAIAGHPFPIVRLIGILMSSVNVWRILSFVQTTYARCRSGGTWTILMIERNGLGHSLA